MWKPQIFLCPPVSLTTEQVLGYGIMFYCTTVYMNSTWLDQNGFFINFSFT